MSNFRAKDGLTLIELLVFAAIFSLVSIGLISVFISFSNIRVRQQALVEVNQQSLFLMQTVQRLVEQSSLVELDAGVSTTTLKLRMASSTADPTYVVFSGSNIFLRQTDAGQLQQLNSSQVAVSGGAFKKHANPPGRDSVQVSFVLSYNSTGGALQKYLQGIDTGIARVNAATFDSNILPSTNNAFKLGFSTSTWNSVNDILYFSGGNVGVGQASPQTALEVNGGVRLYPSGGKPGCVSGIRGTFWYTPNGAGTKDNVEVCVKNASDTYLWATIY